jgi:hypothetical protein
MQMEFIAVGRLPKLGPEVVIEREGPQTVFPCEVTRLWHCNRTLKGAVGLEIGGFQNPAEDDDPSRAEYHDRFGVNLFGREFGSSDHLEPPDAMLVK